MKLSYLAAAMAVALAGCAPSGDEANANRTPTPAGEGVDAGAPALPSTEPTSDAPALEPSAIIATKDMRNLSSDCNFEAVDGTMLGAQATSIRAAGAHEFSGWMVDAEQKRIPSDLRLVLEGVSPGTGVWTSDAVEWSDRAGVAQTRGYDVSLNNSGFSFRVDTGKVQPGLYHVFAMGKAGDVVCDTNRQVAVTP